MALRQHDHASAGQVQTHQMDEATRPYFIHHRNQVGINKALMDLFSLIDQFLQTDPHAREHLMALRALSDFVQQKQLVARMPSHGNPVDYYAEESGVEQAGNRGNSMNVVADLLRVVQGFQVPNSIPPSQPPPGQMHFPHYTQPIQFPHTPPPSAPVTATSHSHVASETTPAHSRMVSKEQEVVTADDSSSIAVSCMQGAADKLRAWLAMPEAAALKKLISSKRSRKQSTSAPPRPSTTISNDAPPRSSMSRRQTQDYSYYGPMAHTNAPNTPTNPPHGTFPRTRSSSISYVDAQNVPRPWVNTPATTGGVWVTTETASKRDSLPPARKRRVSVAAPAADERNGERSSVHEKSKRASGHSTDHEQPSTSAKIKKKRPTSISFAVGEREREPGSTSAHPPSAYSPLSSGVRNTMSSDGSILDAPILHAKRDTIIHAAAYTTSPESGTKNVLVPQDRHERRGSNATDRAYDEGTKRERNLPPLPDESTSSQSPDESKQARRQTVPNIMVQPPSSAGTLTPQTARSPMPSRSAVVPAPNHLGIPISSSARTYVPSPTARNAVQGSSSTPRASQHFSPPKLPLPPSRERSQTVSSDPTASSQRPISLYVHAPTSNAEAIRSASAGPHATPSQVVSRESRMGPAVVKIYEDARPSVIRQGSTSSNSGHRKPAPPLTPPSSANHSRSHEDEGNYSSTAERRPLSSVRNPVITQQQSGTPAYPSPKSNHGAEATIHQVSLAPTSTTQYPHGTTTYVYKDPSNVVEAQSTLGHSNIHASKSRFSIETAPSSGTDRESRRRFSVARNSAHTAYNTDSGLSRHGDYLASIAEKRKPSIRSDQSNVSGSSGHASKAAAGDDEKARMTDDSKVGGHARNRPESKQYKIWLPEDTKQNPSRSRSERVPSSGLRHVWRAKGDGSKEWFIDDSLVQTANVQKRPTV